MQETECNGTEPNRTKTETNRTRQNAAELRQAWEKPQEQQTRQQLYVEKRVCLTGQKNERRFLSENESEKLWSEVKSERVLMIRLILKIKRKTVMI